MWFLLSLLSLVGYAVADLQGKKRINAYGALAPIELLVFSSVFSFSVGVTLSLLGFGESGVSPWQILRSHPLIFANILFYTTGIVLQLFSLRFIGLSVEAALSGTLGVFYFVGVVIIYLASGKLTAVGEMLHPLRLIPILCVLLFTVLLPNIEVLAHKNGDSSSLHKAKEERGRTLIGLLLLFFSLVCEAIATMIVTWIFDQQDIGALDYLKASYCTAVIPAVLFSLFLWRKRKRRVFPLMKIDSTLVLYAGAHLLGALTYLYASAFDAVRTGMIFIAYPIVPILGAKLFLKEKYTWRQNLCIWIITLSSIAFCVIDSILKR